jgi:hypothetical protein
MELPPDPGRFSGKLDRVGVHNGRRQPAVDLDLHSDRSNQRDGNGDPAQDEPNILRPLLSAIVSSLCSLPNSLTRAYDDNW